ncbi:MAG: DUF2177 family protein [Erysipelotrichaceae bacterium]|nr:DUF2177 family protein [Erysipelotrichaceae bacterium]
MENIRNYLVSFAVFLLIDMVWLGLVARTFYTKHLGYIMADKANFVVAFVFYAIFTFGLLFFVISPALAAQNPVKALTYGLLFGFITYATYDLTNMATLKDWPLIVTIVDLLWGTFLGGTTAWLSFMVITKLFK